ncbi:alpha/beta fold hydrolase [Burkholderia cepacia]|uniref:alpha/beta fold hydrolase n=1 Tax=Burkholderia cepacia TaxID=292 RepID=UPI001F31E125|nr:alpha/beta hydrolase [Burkholderia cepacia]MCE4124470.1 alpha/beta hydrolase [Burkholderia cepacia]
MSSNTKYMIGNEKYPEYSELPERAAKAIESFIPPEDLIAQRIKQFSYVEPRAADTDGRTETFDGVSFVHRFVDTPGDDEMLTWHYVEAGEGEPVVFLHGIPDSWFQWVHQMSALSTRYRCIAVDLKGYGQSSKGPGDYRHEGAAEQLYSMLQQIGVTRFNLVTHDRGTVQGDFIAANHSDSVLRYARGEQHLYHFNPVLAPQGEIFMNSPWTGIMEDPKRFVLWVYTWITKLPIPENEMARVIQEFSYAGITRAVPRYFNSSSFRQEWLVRRDRLLAAWTCPVLIIQGHDSKTQPREFYEAARDYIPNAKDVQVRFLPGGHFWTLESPGETTAALWHLMSM